MPALEHLFIASVPPELQRNRRLQLAIRHFLMSRTRLKTFYIHHITIDPEFVFAQPGKELKYGWVCSSLDIMSFKFVITTESEQDQAILLGSVYRQLGCLPRLRVLSIECQIPQDSHTQEILQLKKAADLKKLTLIGFGNALTLQGIVAVMEAAPGLETLELKPPLSYSDRNAVSQWLKKAGRLDVELLN
ncbi:hypothetical protein BGZ96_004628 [Linnemannia gamsii]|uniref:Uncharacterized protein n=1 Tax=Linnemannia gamsii TaxID=64522 RepID=A0ABQ7K6P6_9FUNG|nr:hypothetical protein BGZ96_004628 [Linnemannia gamsii]